MGYGAFLIGRGGVVVELAAFSQEWAEAWAKALNGSTEYQEAAATWEGAVALVVDDGVPETRCAVLLDLWHGACRGAGVADPDALDAARFVFRANSSGWREALSGNATPAMALMSGKIRLIKGNLADLLPYALAAKRLLDLAGQVPTRVLEG